MSDRIEVSHPSSHIIDGEIDAQSRHQFTVDEYHRMVGAGVLSETDRVELLNGEIVKMMPIGPLHIGHVIKLDRLFQKVAGRTAFISCQNSFIADRFSEPEPDIVLLKQRSDFYTLSLATPDDVMLLVEVAESSLARDRSVKMLIYARSGIREYWVINLVECTLEVYRKPSEKGYAWSKIYTRKDFITPLAFPKKKIAVKDLLLPIKTRRK